MGRCHYCQMNAGFLKHEHPECREKVKQSERDAEHRITEVLRSLENAVLSSTADDVLPSIAALRKDIAVDMVDVNKRLLQGADQAAMRLAQEHPVSNEDAERVAAIFACVDEDFLKQGARLVQWPGYVSLTLSYMAKHPTWILACKRNSGWAEMNTQSFAETLR